MGEVEADRVVGWDCSGGVVRAEEGEVMSEATSTVKLKRRSKQGRVDLLVRGVVEMGAKKLEVKTGLQGLSNALMPIVDEEIRKHITVAGRNVIPREFRDLADLVNKHVIQH